MTPGVVSTSPLRRKTPCTPIAAASGGASSGSNSKKSRSRLPGKSYQATARAAGIATASASTATADAIARLAPAAANTPESPDKTYSQERELHLPGMRDGQNQDSAKE